MGTLAVEIKRAEESGDKKVNGFSGAVRSVETTALEVGDEWTFPTQYEVWSQKVGEHTAQYIFIDIKGNAKRFYPSTFTKARAIVDEDGTTTGKRAITGGSAAELYRTCGRVEDGMNLLAGKKVRVTNVVTVRTLRYGTTNVVDAQIPTIDLVD